MVLDTADVTDLLDHPVVKEQLLLVVNASELFLDWIKTGGVIHFFLLDYGAV